MSKSGRLYMDKLEESHAMIQELADALIMSKTILLNSERDHNTKYHPDVYAQINVALSKARQGETV